MRRRGLCLLVALCAALGGWLLPAQERVPYREAVEAVEAAEAGGLDSAADNAAVATACVITAQELRSPMMTDSRPVVDKSRYTLTDWCIDHLLLSGALACLLIGGGIWVLYKLCSFFFITCKR